MKMYKSLTNPTPEMRSLLRHEMREKGFYFLEFHKIHDDKILLEENKFKVDEELWIFEKREPISGLDD